MASVAATPIAFPAAVPMLGTTSATTLTFAATTFTNLAIDIGNFKVEDKSGNSYAGSLEAGSCILVIKVSTFQPPSPYAVGMRIAVNPCSFTAKVAGVAANGIQTNREVVVALGTSTTAIPLAVTISANGQVKFGNNVISTVALVPAAGS
ncbi:MAG: hypothetical protein K9K38_22900 [Rhodoferax sp.]|nr:hypothetical protein [Rhodoferax sp.]